MISSAALLGSCKSNPEKKVGSAAPPPASASTRLPPPPRRNWPKPSGPVLAVLAGRGVGPIRIGATVSTIERHMGVPCELKTAEACRYFARGVEFLLADKVVETIHVHRAGRPGGKDASGGDAEYGFFNGAIPPDLQLGMIPSAVQEHLGPPRNVERREVSGAALNVEVHVYEGMRVEYDRLPNGNLVMGGIVVRKEPKPEEDGGAAPVSAEGAR